MEGDITLGLKYVGAGLATLGMIGAAIGVGNIFGSFLDAAMMTRAMIWDGTIGVVTVMVDLSQSGALPPGVGSTNTASPAQTKDMPSVTTIEGRFRK